MHITQGSLGCRGARRGRTLPPGSVYMVSALKVYSAASPDASPRRVRPHVAAHLGLPGSAEHRAHTVKARHPLLCELCMLRSN